MNGNLSLNIFGIVTGIAIGGRTGKPFGMAAQAIRSYMRSG
jgi:hypothetical protein